ncbi:hypothetical protein [Brachyspira innocens]|uniref:hypothetical protein n=1 Tax=Brachyspira innocens TaxID=13264 RepID=UPI0026EC3B7E|nr:hypothetical protein [Brachyspira innocens]
MKKVSILLISVLFALAVSCSNPTTNPDNQQNTEDGTQNSITLAQRAGTYSGTMNGMQLVIVLNNQAQVTSITINNGDNSITEPITIKEGPTHTGTTIAPFNATVNINGFKSTATVSIEFKSQTDKTAGATAYVKVPATTDFNKDTASKVDLKYAE